MKPVFQTEFYDPKDDSRGNCVGACIASIFEIPLEDVDLRGGACASDVMEWTKKYYPELTFVDRDFSKNYRYNGKHWEYDDGKWYAPRSTYHGYWIGSIYSPRIQSTPDYAYYPRPGLHAIVMKGRKCVHDPHPEGSTEFEGPITHRSYWVCMN